MNYDLAIIGGGAAGMAAAVFASENGVRTVVIEHNRQLGKSFGYKIFRPSLCYLFVFVSKVFADKYLYISPTVLTQNPAHIVRIGISEKKEKTIFVSAHISHNISVSAVKTYKSHILPRLSNF